MRVTLALTTSLLLTLFVLAAPLAAHEGHNHDEPVRSLVLVASRGDNILTGTSPVELAAPIRGAIQITNSKNRTVQAKF